MCGIVGIFNNEQAKKQIKKALAVLKNRGKDGSKILELSAGNYFGHSLHAVVSHVVQPLQGEGVLVANCEIYNWETLNTKYGAVAKNDADFLIWFS